MQNRKFFSKTKENPFSIIVLIGRATAGFLTKIKMDSRSPIDKFSELCYTKREPYHFRKESLL